MNFFRRHLDSKVSKFIAIIIIVIFVGWEFITQSLNKPNTWLFKVGDIEYTAKDWQETYKALTNDPMSAQEAIANPRYAKQRVLDEMIKNALIPQEAKSIGFSVSDKMVASEIVHMKIFKGEDGKFDQKLLEKTLKINNLTEAEFIRNMKEQLLRNQLMDIFYNTSGIMAKPTYELLVKLIAAEQKITVFGIQTLSDEIKYSDDDLKKYMNEHKENFMTDDEADISEVVFNTDLIEKSEPTESEIQKYYEENSIFEPEKRLVNQVVIPSYNDAKELLEKIKTGKMTFDDVARVYAGQQIIPYEVGPFVADGFDPDIAKVVFNLPEGGVSELVQTPLGWHIFRVKKVIDKRRKDFSEVKDKIVETINAKRLSEAMNELLKNVMQDIESSKTIEEIAAKYNLKVSNTILNSSLNKSVQNGISQDKLFNAVFKNEEPGIKLLTAQDNKSFILVKVNKIIQGVLMDFNDVKDRIVKKYTVEELDKRTKDFVKEERKKVLDASDRSKAVLDERVKKSSVKFSRINKNDGIPECLQELIVDMYKNGVFDGLTSYCKANGAYYFALLNEMDFSTQVTDEQKASLRPTIHGIYNEIVFGQFIEHLKSKYKVELDDKFIKYMNE